ncbi:MAG: 16S rRNA (guanine(966)-N(2))-methyltransferase RsmD [Nitrospinae bacterium]|nr:16S rRNA (guanine(966)-N(2))-methyltransferase RsmD [Nitrospinota bacterium]
MTMRVVAGTQKGRRLKEPTSPGLRPTSGRVKEALFSMIAERLPNANVLDLYAGTGALGLEAMSRGARKVVFVENQPASVQVLRENITRCQFTACSSINLQDVQVYLNTRPLRQNANPFDLVFADPPYEVSELEPLLNQLDSSEKVATNGLVVIEHFKKASLPLKRVGSGKLGNLVMAIPS